MVNLCSMQLLHFDPSSYSHGNIDRVFIVGGWGQAGALEEGAGEDKVKRRSRQDVFSMVISLRHTA